MSRSKLFAAAVLALAATIASPIHAGSIVLAWDALQSGNLAGYKLYYGPSSGNYTNSVSVGSASQYTLNGLTDCTTWYLAMKAYDSAGNESTTFSNEITGWARPAVTQASPSAAMQGRQVTIDITGSNYKPGATVEIDNPNVVLENVSTLSCNRIQVLATVEPTAQGVRAAEIGSFDITVVNPDDVYGTRTDAFEVTINPARFDLDTRDFSTDGRLDGRDVIWLARIFGQQDGSALYDPDSDLTGDGWLDGDDLAHLTNGLGLCWSGSAWTTQACQ